MMCTHTRNPAARALTPDIYFGLFGPRGLNIPIFSRIWVCLPIARVCLRASSMRCFPASVRAPVLIPPWLGHLLPRRSKRRMHGVPSRVLAPHLGLFHPPHWGVFWGTVWPVGVLGLDLYTPARNTIYEMQNPAAAEAVLIIP